MRLPVAGGADVAPVAARPRPAMPAASPASPPNPKKVLDLLGKACVACGNTMLRNGLSVRCRNDHTFYRFVSLGVFLWR